MDERELFFKTMRELIVAFAIGATLGLPVLFFLFFMAVWIF